MSKLKSLLLLLSSISKAMEEIPERIEKLESGSKIRPVLLRILSVPKNFPPEV